MVTGLKGSTYEEKCEELGLETLEERRGRANWNRTIQAHSCPGQGKNKASSGRTWFISTDPRKYSFAVRTVENWNKLPEDVKTSRNGEEFKNKLKKL